jgi:hypothetical protein
MYGPFFPRIKPKGCDGFDPTLMCVNRREASRMGTFYWDARRGGYCYTRLEFAPWGIPVLLDACPFCKELLPGPQARRRWEEKNPNPIPKEDKPPIAEMDCSDGDAD